MQRLMERHQATMVQGDACKQGRWLLAANDSLNWSAQGLVPATSLPEEHTQPDTYVCARTHRASATAPWQGEEVQCNRASSLVHG